MVSTAITLPAVTAIMMLSQATAALSKVPMPAEWTGPGTEFLLSKTQTLIFIKQKIPDSCQRESGIFDSGFNCFPLRNYKSAVIDMPRKRQPWALNLKNSL